MSAANAVDTSVWFDLLVGFSGIGIGVILSPIAVALVNSLLSSVGIMTYQKVSDRPVLFSSFLLRGELLAKSDYPLRAWFGRLLFYLILSYDIAIELVRQGGRQLWFLLLSSGLLRMRLSWCKFHSSKTEDRRERSELA